MRFSIAIKPLSINEAFQGRRFNTKMKANYERDLARMLPKLHIPPSPFYRISFDFHLVNFSRTDYDNLIKVTQDCLVKNGIITDDRKIIDSRIRKFPSKKNVIEIEIKGVDIVEKKHEFNGGYDGDGRMVDCWCAGTICNGVGK